MKLVIKCLTKAKFCRGLENEKARAILNAVLTRADSGVRLPEVKLPLRQPCDLGKWLAPLNLGLPIFPAG